jgi:hypothetical protein
MSTTRRSRTKALYERVGEGMRADGYPSLPAIGWKDGTATIWCPYCQHIHTHGAQSGHRAAHCADGPYLVKGYYINILYGE